MSVSSPHASQAPSHSPQHLRRVSCEAARYALLRRMASAIRHQVAGSLQPVGMLASLMERRAQAEFPNIESLRKNASELGALSRSASRECVDLMEWIAPQDGALVSVGEGVKDCVHMLATELSFRGFEIVIKAVDDEALVACSSLRAVLPAALMVLTDNAGGAGQVEVSARSTSEKVALSLKLVASARSEPPLSSKSYRALTHLDIVALADDEGVELQLSAESAELTLDRVEHDLAGSASARWG